MSKRLIKKKIGRPSTKKFRKCLVCNNLTYYYPVAKHQRIYCSPPCAKIGNKGKKKTVENSPHWRGGKSYETYGFGWKNFLKYQIRNRDNFSCKICGKLEHDSKEKLHVHHIDYNKKNLNPKNLISLCRSCHTKTNFNCQYWQQKCSELITETEGVVLLVNTIH